MNNIDMNTIHFRDFKKVYMIDCLEGDGTEDSPSRIVHYIYDDNADRMIGKIDPMDSFSS